MSYLFFEIVRCLCNMTKKYLKNIEIFNYEIEKWDSNCEMGFCDVPNFEAKSLENSGFEKNVKMF